MSDFAVAWEKRVDPRAVDDYYFAVVSALGRGLTSPEERAMRLAIDAGTAPRDFAQQLRTAPPEVTPS